MLTDCTLVGGDSGGPLVDLRGNVVGIHSRIGADLTTNLHVPIDRFAENWGRLANKEVWGLLVESRPWIGVEHDQARGNAGLLQRAACMEALDWPSVLALDSSLLHAETACVKTPKSDIIRNI